MCDQTMQTMMKVSTNLNVADRNTANVQSLDGGAQEAPDFTLL